MTYTLPELFVLAVALARTAAEAGIAYVNAALRMLAVERTRQFALSAFICVCAFGLTASGVRPEGVPGV